MDEVIIKSINTSIEKLIDNSMSNEKLCKITTRHINKPHFIPLRYRILGGILQSMNIQFGNFLENVISLILIDNGKYRLLPESGKKNIEFMQSTKSSELIDKYILKCQEHVYSDSELMKEFTSLLKDIKSLSKQEPYFNIKHDIDLFFCDKNENYIYCEIKYNDDHDTGKFIDINRKFLITYSLLSKKYDKNITPYLFYFTNKRLKGNIYVPETHILRGNNFFQLFTPINYKDVDEAFKNISEDKEINKKFDSMASKILNRNF